MEIAGQKSRHGSIFSRLLIIFALLIPGCGQDSAEQADNIIQVPPSISVPPAPQTPPPIIEVIGESRMLNGVAPVTLTHTVDKVLSVYSFDDRGQKISYDENTDWVRSGNGIARTSQSRIPDFSKYDYKRTVGNRFSFSSEPRNPPLTINFNVYVDYTSQQGEKIVTRQPMSKESKSILCLGDSISAGAHTIESFYKDNDSQSWCGLLRSTLAPDIVVRNEGVPGGALNTIARNLPTYIAIPGDTVVLAFGMNDHVFEPEGGVATFSKDLVDVVSAFRTRGSNVILVGFFQKNELWDLEDPAKTLSYNNAIETVSKNLNVPFIDIYKVYEDLRINQQPQFFHLTADFIHHPNIYGQRIYYSLLIPYFLRSDTKDSQIKHYVRGSWTR